MKTTTIAIPVGMVPSTAPPPPSTTSTAPAIPAGTVVTPGTVIRP